MHGAGTTNARGGAPQSSTPAVENHAIKGAVVLVTGSSSGVGAATALALSARGASVALLARREDRLEELASRIRGTGGVALEVPADVRDEVAVSAAFRDSVAAFGRLDALVNSAGMGEDSPLLSGDLDCWRRMLDVNLLGTAIACREALSHFDKGTGGHIVNINSTSGHRVRPSSGFYAVTKFALTAFTETLRQELAASGSPSRVSSVSPGRVVSELWGDNPDRTRASGEMTASDVGQLVADLLETPRHLAINDLIVRAIGQVQ